MSLVRPSGVKTWRGHCRLLFTLLIEPEIALQCSREMSLDGGDCRGGVAGAAGFQHGHVLTERTQGERNGHLPVETKKSQVVSNAPIARIDQRVVEACDDRAVERLFQLFQVCRALRRQPVALKRLFNLP